MKFEATLAEVQENPKRLGEVGLTTLAFLQHEAEDNEDDVTLLAVLDEAERRGKTTETQVIKEYRRLLTLRRSGQ